MDFNQLMAKMRELDAPVQAAPQAAVQECGDPMGMPSAMPPSMNDQPPPAHPSMSVNLNAQGMDNIESLLKLMTKVNPDMINQPAPMAAPALSAPPTIAAIKPPMPSIGSLGNLDAGPLKMLPDLDSEPEGDHDEPDADNFGGPSDNDADNKIDMIQKSMGDKDGDGDKDKEDDEAEEDDEEEKKEKDEGFGNGLTGHDDVDYKGMDAAVPDGNDLNKPKSTFPKVAGGDNPMQRNRMESKEELRASIRAELLSRLNETKVTELSKDTLKSYQDKAGKDIADRLTSGDYATTDKSAKKVMNRFKGSEKADNKIYKKDNA